MLKFKAVGETKKERKKREKRRRRRSSRRSGSSSIGRGWGGGGRGKNHGVMTISETLLQNLAVLLGTAQGGLCLPN